MELTADYTDRYQLQLTTTEAGKVEGYYISYLQNIEDNIDTTGGSLTTGDLGKWEDFIISLDSQNIAFRITAGGPAEKPYLNLRII